MTIQFDYSGKVAFVTGAGTGIGRAAALAFARAGASVAVVGRTETSLVETVRQVAEAGGRALAIAADVANQAEVAAAVSRAVETFGRLDFAFNNAGVEQPNIAAGDIGTDEWTRQIGINLNGGFFCMTHEIEQMLKQGGGVIVNTGSGAAAKGFPGQDAYWSP